ncbi:MAG: LysR family transcriptional regulator [Pseudomonadota bacterium]
MSRNVDIGLLRSFVAVYEAGSITAAANQLHLTQGAVSQQIKRLELLFSCAVFERDRHGARLTNEGERLLGYARRLLRMNDEVWAEMSSPAFSGEVRLGVPHDLVGTHLARILKAFAQSCPNVEISLISASSPELQEALRAGKVELALVEEVAGEGTAGGECLAVEPLVWVGCAGGEAYRKRPLPVAIVTETCAFRPRMFAALDAQGLPWRTVFENSSIEATSATVRMDMTVTAWLASTVPLDLQILDASSGLPALPDFTIKLCQSPVPLSAPAQEMARHIRAGYLDRLRQAA